MSDRLYFHYNICLFICYYFWHGSNHKRIERKKEIINKKYFSLLTARIRLLFPCCHVLLDTMLVVLLLSLNFQGLNMLSMILWNLFLTGDQTQNLFGAMTGGSMCADGDMQHSTCAWKQTLISQARLAKQRWKDKVKGANIFKRAWMTYIMACIT